MAIGTFHAGYVITSWSHNLHENVPSAVVTVDNS